MKMRLFSVFAVSTLVACGGGGGSDSGSGSSAGVVQCDLLKNWAPGEEVVYRFSDLLEEWLVSLRVLELRSGLFKYETEEDQVRGGSSSSRGTSTLTWEGGCPPFVTLFGNERVKLIMGQKSTWGTFGANQNFQTLEEQSCEQATRQTAIGIFPVTRCLKYGLAGPLEPVSDDFHSGGGAVPGGGFIARQVNDSLVNEALAVVEWWNGR